MTNSTTTQGSTAESGTVHPVHYSRRQMLRNLPSELKSRILDFLDFEGISSIRLTSRGFAVIGASQLWANGLILRPYRNHMQRLTEVCSCPRIVQLIDKLTISLDDTDQESIKQVSISSFVVSAFCHSLWTFESSSSPSAESIARSLNTKWLTIRIPRRSPFGASATVLLMVLTLNTTASHFSHQIQILLTATRNF
jgi:hypothetical protein